MLEIKNLEFAYKRKKPLFTGLNLELKPGNIYGLLGKNGAGKTTLLKIMSGLRFPDKGSCLLESIPGRERNPKSMQNIFFIPEEFELPNIRIDRFAEMHAVFYPNYKKEEFDRYMEQFGVQTSELLQRLSYGQKKMVLISFGLALNTPLLLMDEPTNGLDIPSKSLFRKMVAEAINDERSFVISTHQVRDLEQLIDPLVIIHNGSIVLNSSIENMLNKLVFKSMENSNHPDLIYSEKSLNGSKAVMRNTHGEMSQANFELLFNATIHQPDFFANL